MSRPIFNSITSEGGLLPADFLQSLLAPKPTVDGLKPTDYHLDPNDRLNDVIAGSWNKLRSRWQTFRTKISARPAGESTTSETRELWLQPLLGELGFGRVPVVRGLSFGDRTFDISHQWDSIPLHLVGTHVDLDQRTPGATGASRGSPHSIVQQLLNADPQRLWGVVSNGWQLRLLRDNAALTRQAYIEFDLQSIFDGDLYPEFVVLWLVLHQSRFEAREGQHTRCWLEMWRQAADQKGLRALEHLRYGVESAITSLGSGLLSNPHNVPLREALSSGQLTPQALYQQILRTVYRMIFLFVAEDRGLLHPRDPSETAVRARARYAAHYSLSRLRELQLSRAGTPHPDLWIVFQLVTRKLGEDGAPELSLPILGSFLWSGGATKDLNGCLISNRLFLEAVQAIAFTQEEGGLRRTVDYRNLGAEELGSVYEGLLEQHVSVDPAAQSFTLGTAAGNERKTSGSYYTPDSLVQCLLDSALEPVAAEAARGKKGEAAAQALLALKICDPAVGSGHFLIAAGHRLAKRVAAARTGEDEPSPEATRTALRDVIGRCLYGVDINPMSAELCRVSLWLEALEPGKPLSFLDHHIQCGNSLIGATPALMSMGIPDEAFDPIEGDDRKYCSNFRKENKKEAKSVYGQTQAVLFDREERPWEQLDTLATGIAQLSRQSDDNIADVHAKEQKYTELVLSTGYKVEHQIADAWCAAFVWKKCAVAAGGFDYPITNDVFRRLEYRPNDAPKWFRNEIERLAGQYQFFHWHLAFPEVFKVSPTGQKNEKNPYGWSGGFDVILGNPPWEHTELKEKEWFAEQRPDIANAPTAAARKGIIETLRKESPALFRLFADRKRQHDGIAHILGSSGLHPLCGNGRINLYAVFAENMWSHLNTNGRLGCILPSGIATDDTTKLFFRDVVERRSLVSLFDFENREGLFPAVDSRMKFSLFTSGSPMQATAQAAAFVFFAHKVEDLNDASRRFSLGAEDIALLNPNTRTCPIFRSGRDAELTKDIHRRVPILVTESPIEINPWGVFIRRVFNMGFQEVATLARTRIQLEEIGITEASGREIKVQNGISYIPMYEGKMFDMFNHRAAGVIYNSANVQRGAQGVELSVRELSDADCLPEPLYWYPRSEADSLGIYRDAPRWFVGYKNISSPTNERSMIAAVLPFSATNFSIRLAFFTKVDVPIRASFVAVLNSFVYDYLLRQSLGGLNLSDYITHQIPVVPPETFAKPCVWAIQGQLLQAWVLPRVLELTYTAWDLEVFAQDCGWFGPPLVWDEARRFQLRCELDAAFFHVYGLSRADAAYILDTFPIVRRKDEARTQVTNAAGEVVTPGRYVTKDTILEIFDALAESVRTGTPYQTRLDPPPADPRCCHPAKVS